MSLIGFLAAPDVRSKIKPLRPKSPRKISMPLKVEPRSKSYMVVGKAFDYLLRFKLQRRAPHHALNRFSSATSLDRLHRELWVNKTRDPGSKLLNAHVDYRLTGLPLGGGYLAILLAELRVILR